MNKPALLIVNLGTPDSPSYFHVFKYLREFLMDGRVIDIPAFFRFILVTLIICPLRSFSSGKIYKQLWDLSGGESPLLKNTRELTTKLNEAQEKFNVFYAMRYQTPSIKSTLAHIQKTNPTDLIVFPLFPHYASASTGSAIEKAMKIMSKWWVIPEVTFISQYWDHPGFIDACIERAKQYNLDEYEHFLFSYHGVPERHVDKVYLDGSPCKDHDCETELTDTNKYCYKATCFATTRLIVERLGIPCISYRRRNHWRFGGI